jgi:hypothetical protein
MSAGLTKGLDTCELKKTPIQFTAMKKPGKKHNFSGMRRAAIVNADPAVAADVVAIILIEVL